MVDIETEKDIERLRGAARQFQEQIVGLWAEIAELRELLKTALERLSKLRGEAKKAEAERIQALKERLAKLNAMLFDPSSERRSDDGGSKPGTGGGDAATGDDPPRPRRGHGRRSRPDLDERTVVHDLDEADKICPACGGTLEEIIGQFESSEEIDVIARRYLKLIHQRKKYRCRCNACLETAPGPLKLRSGAGYSINVAIDIAINKYHHHLPLERQVIMMRAEGLEIDSQTLWDQLYALAQIHKDLPNRILAHILSESCVGADETHWRYLAARGKEEVNRRWYMWSVCGSNAVVHRLFDTRSHTAAKELLGVYAGAVMTDGYAAYQKLAGQADVKFILAHCWAHCRRKFYDAEKAYGQPAAAVLNLIAAFFQVDADVDASQSATGQLAQRAVLREQRSQPIVDALRVWAEAILKTHLPSSSLGKAASYMLGLWDGLTRFLSDANIPLSNNHTERALRGPVVGRKNHYGSKSKRGTEVAALFYTVVESAKMTGINPRDYLQHATRAALRGEDVLLPHQFAQAQQQQTSASRAA